MRKSQKQDSHLNKQPFKKHGKWSLFCKKKGLYLTPTDSLYIKQEL